MAIHKIFRFFKRNGFLEGSAKLFHYISSLFFYQNVLVLLVKNPFFVAPDRALEDESLTIHRAEKDDLEWLDRELYLERREILRRLARGDVCAFIAQGERIVASAWGAFVMADIPEIFLQSPLPQNTGYIFTVECDKSFRRRGLATAVVAEVEQMAAGKKVRTMTVAVHPNNHASMQLFCSQGYRPFKEVRVSRLLGIKRQRTRVIEPSFARILAPSNENCPPIGFGKAAGDGS